jgi:hypothetical protein
MFIPFYEDRSKFEIAAELFHDAAYVAGYAIGFCIALYEHFTAPTAVAVTPTVTPQPELSRDALRAQCKVAGIRWNRAGEGGKHLTKTEMIARLAEVTK